MIKYPKSLLEYPASLIKLLHKTDPIIYEIGANDGSDTVRFVKYFQDATIVCFEPEPRAAKVWKQRPELAHAKLYECALGSKSGESIFYQSGGTKEGAIKEDWDFSGSLNKPTGHLEYSPWVTFKDRIVVSVEPLNKFNLNRQIDLIWMDVQGGEQNVILGGQEVLEWTRFLYTEYGHWKKPLYEGQMDLSDTQRTLGSNWKLIALYEGCNALFQNRKVRT